MGIRFQRLIFPPKFFKSEQDAALLLGAMAAMPAVTDAALPKQFIAPFSGPIPFLLLLAPAVAQRSWRRLIFGLLLPCPLLFVFMFFVLIINGRNELPLTVWALPWPVAVPWYDSMPIGWQGRALYDCGLFWALFALGMVALHKRPVRINAGLSILAGSLTIVAGTIFAVLLFRLSWGARVSGTFAKPLYTPTQYYTSLTLYFLSFACTPWFVHALYDKLIRRSAANTLRSSSNGISAECFGPDDDLTV